MSWDATVKCHQAAELLDRKRYKEAIEVFTEAIKLDANKRDAFYGRGVARFNLAQYAEARDDLDNAIRCDNVHAYSYLYRGRAFLAMQNYDSADADFRQVMVLQPTNLQAVLLRIEVLIELGKFTLATELAEKSMGKIHGLRRSEQADFYFLRGRLSMREGKYHGAKLYAEQALKLEPDVPEYHVELVHTMLKCGLTEEAHKYVEDCKSRFPDHLEMQMLQISVLASRRQKDQFLELANRLKPQIKTPDHLFDLADAFLKLSMKQEAQDPLKESKEHLLSSTQLHRRIELWHSADNQYECFADAGELERRGELSDAYAWYSVCYLDTKDFVKSEKYARLLLEKFPSSYVGHLRLGLLYKEQEQLEKAKESLSAVITMVKAANSINYVRATVHMMDHDYKAALQDLETSSSVPGFAKVSRVQAIVCYIELNQLEKAMSECEDLLKNIQFESKNFAYAVLTLKGNIHSLREQLAEAKACYEKAMEQQSEPYGLLSALAGIASDEYEFEKAADLFKKSLELIDSIEKSGKMEGRSIEIGERRSFKIGRLTAFSNLGYINAMQGKLDDAEAAWLRALEFEDSEGHVALRRAEFVINKTHEFQKAFEWLELAKNSVNKKTSIFYKHFLEKLQLKLHDAVIKSACSASGDNKINEIFQAIRMYSDAPELYIERGKFYNSKEQYELALADFETVLAFLGNDITAHTYRGIALHKLGRNNEAIDSFTKALADKSVPLAHYYRGLAYGSIGRIPDAVKDLEKSLALYEKLGKKKESERSQSAIAELQSR